ncbi:ABC transporter permease subunit [Actinotalea sp. Marseille-Q4924]|uniref:ABC transporter permease subunit n=1 Tax=Actinotalea sp. Marseille-Q4924 TaxID=2866571 RepID=UPI001CE4AD03|nr:ABC transporter permease subunit [Actinotalea sp. Marseille-Q4924]
MSAPTTAHAARPTTTAPAGTVLRGVLHSGRRSTLLWTVAVCAVGAMYTAFYPSVGGAKMDVMLEAMPPELITAMGFESIATAGGYVQSTVYQLLGAILVLVCAIGLGARLLAGAEEDAVLELELTAPVSRTTVYVERLASLWLVVLVLVVALTAVLVALTGVMGMDLPVTSLAAGSLGLWLFGGALGTLAYAVGAATGRRASAVGAAAGVAVLSYVLAYLGPLVEGGSWMEQLSPYHWYVGGDPLTEGVSAGGYGLLVALAVVAAVVGVIAFRRRDVMV